MNQESVFTNLPPELIINILSRLPVRPVVACKLVCKPWLELLETREFADSHLSKSIPGLFVSQSDQETSSFTIFELKDELNLESHELHYDLVAKIDHNTFINPSHQSIAIEGSVNGLIFLRNINGQPHAHYICNPITREYIELSSPDGKVHSYPTKKTYGFGVSETTKQHKVVRILHECVRDDNHALLDIPNSECHVYTLGTGQWRKIEHGLKLEYNCRSIGAFLNGNLHWLVMDLKGSFRISCFDLETESFRTWNKECVISKCPDFSGECYEVVRPMKVFRDGDVLMTWQDYYLFYYSSKNRTTKFVDTIALHGPGSIESTILTPSFLSLNDFDAESVRSF